MSVPDSLLRRLAEVTAEATQSDIAVVLISEGASLKVAAGHNVKTHGVLGASVPLGKTTFCGKTIAKDREAMLDDISKLPAPIRPAFELCGAKVVLGIPITGSESTGILLLGTSRYSYNESEILSAKNMAWLAAPMRAHDRLLNELSKEVNELRWLSRITDRISLEDGHDKVITAIAESASELLEADAVALYLLDDHTKRLNCAVSDRLPFALVEPKSDKQQSMLLDALGQSEPLSVPDLQQLPTESPLRELILDVNIRSVIGLQLRHRGKPIGLLVAMYRRPNAACERRMELCRVLALDAGVALNYSRLLEQSRCLVRDLEEANERLQQQAVHDGLTGLPNHRSFHQRLTEFVHRVGRYGETFSVAMLDVDHFKAYNDAYGHQEGDLALQQIAQIISKSLREADLPARYGGEEFAIIMPHTSKTLARIGVERIRKAIDTFVFRNGKLTISGGIAECPSDGVTANEVLEKADRALYHSKLTGRNRVCLWATSPEDNISAESSSEGRVVTVLVVENDREARRAMESALHQAGYELSRASSTQEAIGLLRSQKFDIMLSDSLILGTEGMQVLGLASSIHPMMPIVVTTAPSMANEARQAMRHGITDLLVKPFNVQELPVVIERNLERKRIERQMLLEKSTGILLQAIDALVAAIDAKDSLTAGHTARVTHISLAIADTLGLPSEERYTLELAARLHDIGKLSLPDSALNKPGRLSDEEWAAMQRHPLVGSQIVGAIEELSYISTIVRHHHERLDGNGYPDGLQGEAIPFLSRIIAVADAFEAMTSERSYRQRMTTDEATSELRRCVGTHYSEEIVEALVESLKSGAIEEETECDAA